MMQTTQVPPGSRSCYCISCNGVGIDSLSGECNLAHRAARPRRVCVCLCFCTWMRRTHRRVVLALVLIIPGTGYVFYCVCGICFSLCIAGRGLNVSFVFCCTNGLFPHTGPPSLPPSLPPFCRALHTPPLQLHGDGSDEIPMTFLILFFVCFPGRRLCLGLFERNYLPGGF